MKKTVSVFLLISIFFVCTSCGMKLSANEISTAEEPATEVSLTETVISAENITEIQTTISATVQNTTVTEATETVAAPVTVPTATVTAAEITTVPVTVPVSTAEKVTVPPTTVKEIPPSATEKVTVPVTEKPTEKVTKNDNIVNCTFEISCTNILGNISDLKTEKKAFVPSDGVIYKTAQMQMKKGSTVLDVIKKACAEGVCSDNCKYCKKNGIQLDYVYTPGYDSYYIKGIHQLYEKDCGTQSGWMYSVNGVFPNYGCSQYEIKDGDTIKFLYTCDLGEDLGAEQ